MADNSTDLRRHTRAGRAPSSAPSKCSRDAMARAKRDRRGTYTDVPPAGIGVTLLLNAHLLRRQLPGTDFAFAGNDKWER